MDIELFVHNVKELCKIKGVSVNTAVTESGAGARLVDNVKRGSEPSVGKVQKLAEYFGVTTSQLLGEVYIKHSAGKVLMEGGADGPKPASPEEDGLSVEEIRLLQKFRAADPALQEVVRRVLAVD